MESEIKALKNRFIHSFKILSSQSTGTGYDFKIEVKISPEDLRQILQQKGLGVTSSKTGITLPFIQYRNILSGESFHWWLPEFKVSNDLQNLALEFEQEIFQGFLEKGLFMLQPQSFSMASMVPPFMAKAHLTETEKVQLTHFVQGQLYLDGKVTVVSSPLREQAYRIRMDIQCKQASNGKKVAETLRHLDTPEGQPLKPNQW